MRASKTQREKKRLMRKTQTPNVAGERKPKPSKFNPKKPRAILRHPKLRAKVRMSKILGLLRSKRRERERERERDGEGGEETERERKSEREREN